MQSPAEDEPERWIARVAAGDRQAFERLYDRYASLVYTMALRITHSHADSEDLIQDVFLQIWRKAGAYRPDRGSLDAWIVSMARNRAIDRLRVSQTDRGRVDRARQGLSEPADDPTLAALIRDESDQSLQSALASLPREHLELLELAYFDGMSQSQIAEIRQMPLGTVKTRIRQALHQLRTFLKTGSRPERVE